MKTPKKRPRKTLGLLRHAKSDSDDLSLCDFDRGLNARGLRGAEVIGAHIRAHGIGWDLLIASPAERVRKTIGAAELEVPIRWEERLYLADRNALIETVRSIDGGAGAVIVAGHNPSLQELIFELVAPEHENDLFDAAAEKYPTAAFAVLELAIDRWADCATGCGTLVHLARPRDLDPALGPERVV